MTVGLAILTGLALQAAQGAGPGTIRGVVRDAADGRPLVGAVVTLVTDGRAVETDSAGRYEFSGVRSGERRVRAARLDFSPLEVRLFVPDGGAVQVDFHLILHPVAMPAVEARASPRVVVDTLDASPGTVPVGTAVVRALDGTPGVAEAGIASAARQFLGPDPPSPDNVLFVRGAGAALDLVLLDGAPVQAPFHLGGLIQPSVAPSVVAAERLQGGVGPRWDGGLSDMLLLESRAGQGRPVRAALYADMLSAGGIAEGGSAYGVAWLASFRGLHGALTEPFLEGSFPQRYADALARLEVPIPGGDTVILAGFWNRETVFLDPEEPEPEPPQWGNGAGSIRYRGDTALGRTELGAAYGEFQTRLPIGHTVPLTAESANRRARLTSDFGKSWGDVLVTYGLHLERLDLRTRFHGASADTANEAFEVRQRSDASTVSLYGGAALPLSRTVRLSAGLRASWYSRELGSGVSPRARLDVLLADDVVLSISAGRYQQLIVAADPDGLPGAGVPTEPDGDPISGAFTEVVKGKADHFVLGIAHAPRPGRELRVDAWWKRATGLPDLNGGDFRSVGIDMWLRQRLGQFQVWGTYSVGWGWSVVPRAPDVDLYSGRHFLRAGVTRDFLEEDLRVDVEVSYGAGLEFGTIPRTDRPVPNSVARGDLSAGGAGPGSPASRPWFSIPSPGPNPVVPSSPDGSYMRLNIQATGRVRARFFGKEQVLFPYFRIVNALNRDDALFYRFDDETGLRPQPVGAIPILPVLGVEWHI